MSDLAPFVAATLRDKVVDDLQKENEDLRKRLNQSQRIELVSGGEDDEELNEGEITLYASGQMEDGTFENAGGLFNVKLDSTTKCPIRTLGSVRLCVGGFHKSQIDAVSDLGARLRDSEEDSESSKGVTLNMGCCWLGLIIHGWPVEDWNRIEDRYGSVMVDGVHLDEYILETLPRRYPNAMVSFVYISFWRGENRGAIFNLPQSLLRRLQEGQEQERLQSNFHGCVMAAMRQFGNLEGPSIFIPQTYLVMFSLASLGVDPTNYMEKHDTVIAIAKLHEYSRSQENPDAYFGKAIQIVSAENEEGRARFVRTVLSQEGPTRERPSVNDDDDEQQRPNDQEA